MPETRHIEEQAAKLLSDTPTVIKVRGRSYQLPPPTLAHLARISAEIARLEIAPIDPTEVAEGSLRQARHSRQIARIIATILGDDLTPWYKRLLRRRTTESYIYQYVTPAEATEILSTALSTLELGDFFALTTFLRGINITRATKVETEATAPGAS